MPKLVVITGIREIDRKLKRLEPAVQKKVVRQAMRVGMKIIATEVKAQCPVDRGITKKNVKTRAVKKKRRGSIAFEVRIASAPGLKKFGKAGTSVFTPALVEYGHFGVPANPFMRRAFEAKGEAAREATLKALKGGVEREAKGGGAGGAAAAARKTTLGRDEHGRFISVPV